MAAIVDDMPEDATPDKARGRIRLLMLANEVSLRSLMPDELARGRGLLQSKPATGFPPAAMTSGELGEAWRGGTVHLPLRSIWSGHLIAPPVAGAEMLFNFPQLIAHLCRSRNLRIGSIVGLGALSDKDGGTGHSCVAGQRSRETVFDGRP